MSIEARAEHPVKETDRIQAVFKKGARVFGVLLILMKIMQPLSEEDQLKMVARYFGMHTADTTQTDFGHSSTIYQSIHLSLHDDNSLWRRRKRREEALFEDEDGFY